MSRAAVRESVTLAGRAERARVAPEFVGAVLGPVHPYGDFAVLLVSELFGNSVRHSDSGLPGATITVSVVAGPGVARVEVAYRSGYGVPELHPAGCKAEGGRGLRQVRSMQTATVQDIGPRWPCWAAVSRMWVNDPAPAITASTATGSTSGRPRRPRAGRFTADAALARSPCPPAGPALPLTAAGRLLGRQLRGLPVSWQAARL